jgi:hypothetical protein
LARKETTMTDLSRFGPIDRWGRSAHPERRCNAKRRQRIEEAADRMACELLKMAVDDNVADSVKLAAIRDALDRAGLAARTAVEVEVGPPKSWEQSWTASRLARALSTADRGESPMAAKGSALSWAAASSWTRRLKQRSWTPHPMAAASRQRATRFLVARHDIAKL